jgi:hypothetical protein
MFVLAMIMIGLTVTIVVNIVEGDFTTRSLANRVEEMEKQLEDMRRSKR